MPEVRPPTRDTISSLKSRGELVWSNFGFSLAINQAGDIAVIGSYFGAWIYKKSGNSWNLVKSLRPNDLVLSFEDQYGYAVAINDVGDVVAVNADTTNLGTTWVFSYNGKDWVQDGSRLNSKDSSIFFVGYKLSMSSDGSILVATANSDTSGAFVVFQRSQTTTGVSVPECLPKPKANVKECKKMIKICGKKHHIKLKWIKQACPGLSDESGCQCDQFCGYSCVQACESDQQCYWTNNQCYNKLTNLPGQPIQTCPIS